MDGSVHIEKALGRASRLEPLHFTLSSAHDLVEFSARLFAVAAADEGRSGEDAEKRIRKSPACPSSVISARSPVS
jgi:hypothetical protein